MTAVDSIGNAMAVALKKPEESKNRFLQVHNMAVTQNKILGFARELKPQKKWEVVHKSTAEMERVSWDAFNAGDRSPMTTKGFFVSCSFGDDTTGHFENVDNDLPGVDKFSDDKLKYFLARYI